MGLDHSTYAGWTGRDADQSEVELPDLEDPVPEGLPIPGLWRMFVMPVGIRRELKVAGTDKKLYLPDQSKDAQEWLHAIGRVAAMGPACFKHERYRELGLDEGDFPQVGDLIMFNAKTPHRFRFKETQLLVVNDDQFYGIVRDIETVKFLKFWV